MTPSEKPGPAGGEHPDQTQKLTVSHPEPEPIQTLKVSRPEAEGPRAPSARAGNHPAGSWMWPLVFGGLVALGAVVYYVSSRGPAASGLEGREPAPEIVPPGAQAYLDQAKAGDAHAMRMLGVMYYYGLNVPQDREKGLHWYRKAAEQGSETARAELARLEGKAAN